MGARYDWASSQYKGGGATVKVEYLSIVVSGDLAFTVGIERQEGARVGDQQNPGGGEHYEPRKSFAGKTAPGSWCTATATRLLKSRRPPQARNRVIAWNTFPGNKYGDGEGVSLTRR